MCRLARQLILTFTLPALCSGYLFAAAANFLFLSCSRGIEGVGPGRISPFTTCAKVSQPCCPPNAVSTRHSG